ncbi:MAG: hypothetical protein KF873_01745 [Gemmataceae bacterium]|nr:hypothetical protein [Gemmataceae bacterium]
MKYDSTLKHLLDRFAADWIGLLAPLVDLPPGVQVEALDADLSTVQAMTDKVFRLHRPELGVLHLEPQSSHDLELPDRLLVYNSLLHRRHGGPVRTVVLLLRREADSPTLSGSLRRARADGQEYLRFDYDVIRVWQMSADVLLAGPIGVLPLAVLADDAKDRLEDVVVRMDHRLPNDPTRNLLLASSFILCGLRYNEEVIQAAYQRVLGMKESVTYQAIIREGVAYGTIAARQTALLDVLEERFGVVPPELVAMIHATSDSAKLQTAIRRAVRVASLDEFQL